MNLLQVLTDVLIPIFLIFGIGFVLGKKKDPDPRPIAHMSIFVFLPSLVFISFLDGDMISKLAVTGVYVIVFTFIMYVLSLITCKMLKFDRSTESALLLSVLFTNSGNFGVPLCTFAFGEEGMINALAYMMYGSVIMYTAAVYIASRGTSTMRESFSNIFKIPLIYALIAAILITYTGKSIPLFIEKPISLLGSAAIPVAMVLLGIQLSHTRVQKTYKPIALSTVFRLVLSPLVAIALTSLMGVNGLLRSVLILESSMPTAINSTLIAIEFDAKPGFVSTVVLVSTIFSVISLSVLLLYLT
ncbi:MAG: AEC family transporter [Theionarchaea archaeon]|nr:AEC family transporter [Theionarchaea archaeon]